MRVLVLLTLFGAASAANLRTGQLPERDPNYNETLGNNGGPDGLGVQPKMVPIGHFGLNKYEAALGKMNEKGLAFRPLLVQPGAFSGKAPEVVPGPPVKPMMIPPGGFAAAAIAKRALEQAKANGTLVEQQREVCKIMDKALGLARFVYLIETDDSKKVTDSKGALAFTDVLCPLLKRRYPQAMCHTTCGAMKAHVDHFFDAKYEGPVHANHASKCQGVAGQQVNFAVLYALSSPRTMFNLTFCASKSEADCPEGMEPIPSHAALREGAKATTSAHSASDADKVEEMVDIAKAEAEAKAMEKGQEEQKAAQDRFEYNMAGQRCCKACNNCPKCKMCSVGTVITPDNPNGGDDTYNGKNVHNVVTDEEAMGVNKPRTPTVMKPVSSAMASRR